MIDATVILTGDQFRKMNAEMERLRKIKTAAAAYIEWWDNPFDGDGDVGDELLNTIRAAMSVQSPKGDSE